MAKLKAVLDTNIFISGLFFPTGHPTTIIDCLLKYQLFELIVSDYLILEIKTVLARNNWQHFHPSPIIIHDVLNYLDHYALKAELPPIPLIKPRDPKDALILQTAISGKADYLVTGDHDLLILNQDQQISPLKIITAADFAKLFHSPPGSR